MRAATNCDEPMDRNGIFWIHDADGEHLFCRAHYDAWEAVHKPKWRA